MDGSLQLTDVRPLKHRDVRRAATRQKLTAAARRLFTQRGYVAVSLRTIADEAGMSTGAVYAIWADKAAVWREAMGEPPPVETPVTRAAPRLLAALQDLIAVRPANWDDGEDPECERAWRAADQAVALAEGQE